MFNAPDSTGLSSVLFNNLKLRSKNLAGIIMMGCLTISGCDSTPEWLTTAIQEEIISATEHPGWSSFRLRGNVPNEFNVRVIAYYKPMDLDNRSCQTKQILSQVMKPRLKELILRDQASKLDRVVNFKIPLTYYAGLCKLNWSQLSLEISEKAEVRNQKKFYTRGEFYAIDTLSGSAPTFPKQGNLTVNLACYGMTDNNSPSHYDPNPMNCYFPNIFLPLDSLSRRTLDLKVGKKSEIELPENLKKREGEFHFYYAW